jgi:hypothetical protein
LNKQAALYNTGDNGGYRASMPGKHIETCRNDMIDCSNAMIFGLGLTC